jgi:hypothetical protein
MVGTGINQPLTTRGRLPARKRPCRHKRIGVRPCQNLEVRRRSRHTTRLPRTSERGPSNFGASTWQRPSICVQASSRRIGACVSRVLIHELFGPTPARTSIRSYSPFPDRWPRLANPYERPSVKGHAFGGANSTDLLLKSRTASISNSGRRTPHCSEMNKIPRSRTPLQSRGDGSELTRATARVADRPSALAGACCAASELHGHIEIWVDEGSAGGEVNQ